ncbi:barstar family protein [Bradyrhizobium sp. HKCCYLS2038]|uniref:barstar family protein n=1 Tax=unclassified Bradyrhizobium TaxID=2631580 RepID=UPI003EC050CF
MENARVEMMITSIELDASSWKTASDFQSAFKAAIAAPEWHGDMAGAFLDSIFGGGMNVLKPPFVIRVVNAAGLAPELKELIHDLSSTMQATRLRRLSRTGEDVAASLEFAN